MVCYWPPSLARIRSWIHSHFRSGIANQPTFGGVVKLSTVWQVFVPGNRTLTVTVTLIVAVVYVTSVAVAVHKMWYCLPTGLWLFVTRTSARWYLLFKQLVLIVDWCLCSINIDRLVGFKQLVVNCHILLLVWQVFVTDR